MVSKFMGSLNTEALDGTFSKMDVVSPVTAFARSAGLKSWSKVVERVNSGQIVRGAVPLVHKSMLSLQVFSQHVQEANMDFRTDELGGLVLYKNT